MKKILMASAGALLMMTTAMASAQEHKITEQDLSALDTDSDRVITEAEMKQFMEKAFHEMDKDADGFISFVEATPTLVRKDFDAVDTNKDGRISLDELNAQMRADFKKADKNGDGRLN